MPRERNSNSVSEFLLYLANSKNGDDRVLPLAELSQTLGISIASLREQLEVARSLGVVEVRPKTGIRRLPYTFRPAVVQSVSYALLVDPNCFRAYADLRSHVEAAYWSEAVTLLSVDDHARLRELVQRAKEKLSGRPIQIPHSEHRELHLTIFSRLNNPFVTGVLEGYWELYEQVGLNVYTDLHYLQQVWDYHEKMVDDICSGNYERGYRTLRDHIDLLDQRSRPPINQKFE